MKKQKGVSLIALIITIIVIIILAAIVMMSGGNTANKAGLARFDSDFDTYRTQVALDSLNLRQSLGARGVNANDPQIYFMTANGFTNMSGDGVNSMMVPVGYVIQPLIYDILGLPEASGDVVAYVINDTNIEGYAQQQKFYGDSNGNEDHFVTSTGVVFTLPGFESRQDDGTIEYHITPDLYYVTPGTSGMAKGKTNLNGDPVNADTPVLLTGDVRGKSQNGEVVDDDGDRKGTEIRGTMTATANVLGE